MRKISILLTAILLANISFSQETFSILDSLFIKLETYNQYVPQNHAYLQTDKDVYTTGDIIWFNILITENGNFTVGNLENSINVNLYDDDGNLIIGDFYNIRDFNIQGDIKIPEGQKRGLYYVAAVLPSEENVNNIFTKPIYIDGFYDSDVLLEFPDGEIIYDASEDIELPINIIDYQGNSVERFNLNYKCYIGNEVFDDGRERADRSGNLTLNIPLPDGTGENPLYVVFSDNRETWEKTFLLKTTEDQIDLEFFPEGGSLISGTNQNIGFIARDIFGNYIPVTGNILDSQGNMVTMASTVTDGFGFFALNLEANNSYSFEITSEYGKGQLYNIPEAEETGFSLSVPRIDDQSIYANMVSTLGTTQDLLLLVSKGNSIEWATQLQIDDAGVVKIPTEGLPEGILLISVLDQNYNDLANRIIYLENKSGLSFELNPVITQDNKINLSVRANDESGNQTTANVLLSISSDLLQLENGQTLSGYFDLNAYLEFPIPNAQAFIGPDNSATNALNYLLIANTFNGLIWEKVVNFNPLNPVSGISGSVVDKEGNPYAHAKISVFNSQDMQLYSETANEKGNFTFENLLVINLADYEITATDENGRGRLEVQLEESFFDKLASQIRKSALKNSNYGLINNDKLSFVAANPEIVTEPPKNIVAADTQDEQVKSYIKMLQSGSSILDAIRAIKPFDLDGGRIIFPGSRNSLTAQGGALIVYDGMKMGENVSILDNYDPYDILEINVYTNVSDIQRFTSLNNVGVIELISKSGYLGAEIETEEVSQIVLYENGFRIPRDFLSPESLMSGDNSSRTTVYWNPWLNLNNASGASFTASLPDLKSGYSIRVEGITEDGQRAGSKTLTVENP